MLNRLNSNTSLAKAALASRAAGFPHQAGTSPADPGITALEQRVAELEAIESQLASVLIVSGNGMTATLKAVHLQLDADVEVKVKCGLNYEVNAGANLTLKAGALAKLNGSAVIVNNGMKPVARNGDPVGNGVVTGGNSSLLA
jgi:hypothetical protein